MTSSGSPPQDREDLDKLIKLVYIALIPHCFLSVPRIVKTQVEVEMEVEHQDGEENIPQEPIITIEEEEEVVLFWEQGDKSKGIRELAMGTAESINEDKEILDYYR